MGLIWAIGWGLVGFLVELIQEFVPGWNGAIVDIWPMALAAPAFLGGVTFSTVLGIAGRRRRLDELSLPRFAAWGALGGGLVGGFIATMGIAAGSPGWGVAIGSTVALLCAGSAAGSLALARKAEEPASLLERRAAP